eukprot:TRINITY_DN1633_c0_g1_i4.p1 TRINITY_DN1633_c0_g1~~TRINITY_DN1633_c0_g1_i4.p1  ORF type:complete len:148 (-),score=29.83 TRINITY_DN1633_c0_g1_i4:582-1025(-)
MCSIKTEFYYFFFFFSSRRRHTRSCLVSWARRCVQETVLKQMLDKYPESRISVMGILKSEWMQQYFADILVEDQNDGTSNTSQMKQKKSKSNYTLSKANTMISQQPAIEVIIPKLNSYLFKYLIKSKKIYTLILLQNKLQTIFVELY